MTARARVRVFIASSLDGFIAGPDDDLSWLPEPGPEEDAEHASLSYASFIEDIGALLMGRGTYDVVRGFDVEWPYGDRAVLVASHRPLDEGPPPTPRRVEGDIQTLVSQAKEAAGGKDVYIDGGVLIRQACEADLVDEINLFLAPVALGSGHALFAGLAERYALHFMGVSTAPGGMVHLHLTPASRIR